MLLCRQNNDEKITLDELKDTCLTFYTQRRNLALTVRAIRNLTVSLEVYLTLLINLVFFMVVYIEIMVRRRAGVGARRCHEGSGRHMQPE